LIHGILLAVGYVAFIYTVSILISPSFWRVRDNIIVVKARLLAVTIFSICTLILLPPFENVLHFHMKEFILTVILLLPFVYLNTIEMILSRESWMLELLKLPIEPFISISKHDYLYIRDFIVGPIVEEIVFRLDKY
jgi:hypothetical protein